MERILSCHCGHALEFHDDLCCRYKTLDGACSCRRSRSQVVDSLIEFERENARLAWMFEETQVAERP